MKTSAIRVVVLLVCGWLAGTVPPLGAAEPNQSRTADWHQGLTDRELAIGRWFSHLTFLQDRRSDRWPHWHDDGSQLGITSLRYQLAFAGYGCAVMAAKTPAYREIAEEQLHDLCERMIDTRVWHYVPHYWKYGDQMPDPCRYENVMYTGHLTQLMCLYELMTGDKRYSDAGWDFAWHDGRKIHYNLKQAIERLHVQSVAGRCGGICCEPGLVFAACNSHSAASFVLFDLLHGTGYADANAKWFDWMSKNFRTRSPASPAFFNLVYHQPYDTFLRVGNVGADCWTLGWGYPWFPSIDLAHQGWKHVLDKTSWQRPAADMLHAPTSLLVGCCGGGSLLPVSNSFVPLLAVQAEGRESPTARQVLRWLEVKYGREADMDGDGHRESYYYDTDKAFRIAATGNIVAALATDGDSMRQLFRTSRVPLHAAPTVAHVDYPNVYVRTAQYVRPILRFTVLKGTPSFQGKTAIRCTECRGKVAIARDGQPFGDLEQVGATIIIHSDVDREHVFEVTLTEK